MDFQVLRDGLHMLIELVNGTFGTDFSTELAVPLAATTIAPVVVLAAYGWLKKGRTTVKRLTGDTLALDDDGRVIVDHIKNDLKKLQLEIRQAAKDNSDTDLGPLLKLLSSRIDRTQDLVEEEDPTATAAAPAELDRHGRIPRRQMIRLVRETILSNLWAGNYFNESIGRRHVFHASFPDQNGERITIKVRTPFVEYPQEEELPYGIDVRHGTRTVMRIQWDPAQDENIAIKYVIRGDWENMILSWNVSHNYIPKITDVHDLETKSANSAA